MGEWQTIDGLSKLCCPGRESHADPHAGQPTVANMKEQMKRYQRQLAEQALKQTRGNKSQAARDLKISPQHLARLLKG